MKTPRFRKVFALREVDAAECADVEKLAHSRKAEARLVEICQDADVAYFDGQYFLEEYFGRKRIGLTAAVPRMDWGHGCIEDVIARCRQCRIKHAVIGHHDPERSWQERFRMDHDLAEESKKSACRIELGKSDVMIDL